MTDVKSTLLPSGDTAGAYAGASKRRLSAPRLPIGTRMGRQDMRLFDGPSDASSRYAIATIEAPSAVYPHGMRLSVWNVICRVRETENTSSPSSDSNSCSAPHLSERYATRRPSGEMNGRLSTDMPSPSGTAVPPTVGARHTRSFHSNTMNDPSGETDGLTARYICDQSRAEESPARTTEASAAAP